MAEYIKREDIYKLFDGTNGIKRLHVADIDQLPAADVEVVKYGRWEDGKCTVCDFDIRELTDGENDLEQWVWDEGLPYCPNCGCKMDLGG